MHRFLSFGCLVAVITCAAPAFAQQQQSRSINAASGVAQQAGFHSRFNDECKGFPVSIRITQAPRGGTVKTIRRTEPITNAELGSGSQCLGKPIAKTFVIFTSEKGYSGPDSFTYIRSSSDPGDRNNGAENRISVTVN